MPPELLLDSDVILKLCIYRLEIWKAGAAFGAGRLGTLAASRFIMPKRIAKARTVGPKDAVVAVWVSFESVAEFLEPTADEIALAAELEALAQRSGAAFDAGESLLLAMLVSRDWPVLVTGDRRAILALGELRAENAEAAKADQRLACLEQLISVVMAQHGPELVRSAICSEPHADAALSICFRCAAGSAGVGGYSDGLASYIDYTRQKSGGVLMRDTPADSDAPRSPGAT